MNARVSDTLLWVFFASMVLLERSVQGHVGTPWWLVAIGLSVLGVAVAIGRSHPLTALLVVLALPVAHLLYLLTTSGGPFPVSYIAAALVSSYLAGWRMPRPRPVLLLFAAIAALELLVVITVNVVGASDSTIAHLFGAWLNLTLILIFMVMCPWLVGRYRRLRRDLAQAGWNRAEQLEREKRITAERERLRERARIAEDMHDSLGHELTLLAVRAAGLQMASDLDERHRTAAAELRSGAAAATERLREIVGVLREGTAPTEPTNEGIDDLVERAESSGMAVRLCRDGDAHPPPMVHGAVHRVVQESLTNAAKHAPGAAVRVRIAASAEETVVTVVNDPPPAGPLPTAPSGGLGLVGLRERVRLAGGTLRAEPCDGGFAVVARLPHDAVAPAEETLERSESALHLTRARRRNRRGLLTALLVPAGIAACLGVSLLSYYVYVITQNSVLPPARFDRLAIGQSKASIDFPPREMVDPPSHSGLASPSGTVCRYYRSDGNILGLGDVYRLCFAHGRLVAKDVITVRDRTGGRD